ncbi:DNA-3-methyladenine glycosylase I [Hoyosella subflava]|uniref:DNA-3-methyladenine glycosylase I n=1 Tax=Hoyosella subflava (strain DSM 45089 / JCM 17490 / NBRC 109087 / DQS3-9A1) TaxID=443218 RepID=F6EPX0_HOYSD|nr:DNA-3-methyladenine glycosylase I [Hoyosella subflava]AEF41791.1 DNA-3-methyladenine glycosylase I [Hoyosella subflava DQS3-9A1]
MSLNGGQIPMQRCSWAQGDPLYEQYHDEEWGRPLHGRDALFERLCLEAFQSGLSWITILRKREAFRVAFAQFHVETVAQFGPNDIERLLDDSGIVRNKRKIAACVNNASRVLDLDCDLDELLWSFAPPPRPRRLREIAEIPAVTAESTAMAKTLKSRGFTFIGPTTAYALMQATGMVDDHLETCPVRLNSPP